MAARLSRWLAALVVIGTLAGGLLTVPSRAQDPVASPGAGDLPADASPAAGDPTATATTTPTETPTATETTGTVATETATASATFAPDGTPTVEPNGGVPPTATATGTPAESGSPTGTPGGDTVGAAASPNATPGQPISLADITVAISCRRQTETITITNSGRRSVYLNTVETMYAPIRAEPFVLEERLRPGKTVVLSMGPNATGRVLSKSAIFTNSAYDRDGVIVGLSIGTISRRCPAADPDATPRPDPTPTTVTKSVALVTTATSLRGAPRSSSPTILTVPKGVTLATTGMAYGPYVSVAYLARRGWVRADAVSFDPPTAPAGRPATTTDTVNFRTGPSTSASVIEVLPPGTRVTYTGTSRSGFRSISHNGRSGWVSADYLAIQSAATEEWIDVNRTTGAVTLYRGRTVVKTYAADVSADASSHGFLATAVGTYYVYTMYEPLGYTPYGDSYIRYWIGFDPNRENGFHSWEMDAAGRVLPESSRATSGCVSTPPTIARAIFAFADLGMRVEVHW